VVIEDARVQQWVRRRLLRGGFEVVATDDGIDALTIVANDPPDLLVLGHVFAWLDAQYVLTRVRREARSARIPVLVITPGVTGDLARLCHSLGVTLLVRRGRGPLTIFGAPSAGNAARRHPAPR
jgi:CheY-like chemotaxis protein